MCHLQISFDKKFPGITRIGNWYKKTQYPQAKTKQINNKIIHRKLILRER